MKGREVAKRAVRAAAAYYDTTEKDVWSRAKFPTMSAARHIAYWIVRKKTKASSSAIGRWFDRDHTTILYGVRRIEAARSSYEIAHAVKCICAAMGIEVPPAQMPSEGIS